MVRKIMLVDDAASVRQVVGIALRRAGYETVEASNGKEALSLLDAGKVDLIISDLNMPVMNGIEFVKGVKQHPTSKFTPVVMLTTEGQKEKMEQGRAAGAKAWILKPFTPAQLLDVVAKLVPP